MHTGHEFLIGVDGGGTGTRARICRAADGRVLGEGQAGPSALGQGVAQAWRHIADAIAEALRAAARQDPTLHAAPGTRAADPAFQARCALGLGLSGAENPGWTEAFRAAAPPWGRWMLDSDGHTALLGAHGGAPGVLVTAGTGSIGVALRADGRRAVAGGWGWQLGDEAGGAWFGQQAVRMAQRALDGRTPAGALARAVLARCGATRPALLDWCAAADQRRYADLALLVFDHEEQDPAAAALVGEGLGTIGELVAALDPEGTLPLVLAGSIGRRLAPRLAAPLQQRRVDARGDALDGALRLLQPPADRRPR